MCRKTQTSLIAASTLLPPRHITEWQWDLRAADCNWRSVWKLLAMLDKTWWTIFQRKHEPVFEIPCVECPFVWMTINTFSYQFVLDSISLSSNNLLTEGFTGSIGRKFWKLLVKKSQTQTTSFATMQALPTQKHMHFQCEFGQQGLTVCGWRLVWGFRTCPNFFLKMFTDLSKNTFWTSWHHLTKKTSTVGSEDLAHPFQVVRFSLILSFIEWTNTIQWMQNCCQTRSDWLMFCQIITIWCFRRKNVWKTMINSLDWVVCL